MKIKLNLFFLRLFLLHPSIIILLKDKMLKDLFPSRKNEKIYTYSRLLSIIIFIVYIFSNQ